MNAEEVQNMIIGCGVAGKIIGWTLASQGQKTVVIERPIIGGLRECGVPAEQERHSQREGRLARPPDQGPRRGDRFNAGRRRSL